MVFLFLPHIFPLKGFYLEEKVSVNQVEVSVILQAFCMLSSFQGMLIVGSDSSDAVFWVSSSDKVPWRFHVYFKETRSLATSNQVVFQHIQFESNGGWLGRCIRPTH